MKLIILLSTLLLLIAQNAIPARATTDPGLSSPPMLGAIKTDPKIVEAVHSKLPLYFELNQGQSAKQVKFLYHGNGYHLYLTPTETIIVLTSKGNITELSSDKASEPIITAQSVVRVELTGANPSPQITGEGKMRSYSNYLIGNDPKKWHRKVPHYAKVRYEGLYSGIDLLYYGSQQQLEYDFVVVPGASPEAITMKIKGTNSVSIDDAGNLVLATDAGSLTMKAPLIYQENDGAKANIPGRYVVKDKDLVGLEVAAYDKAKPLIIDPVIQFSTYLGGQGWDCGYDIAVDNQGAVYVAGVTQSWDFPATSGALDTVCGDDFYLDCDRPYPPSGYTFSYEDALDAFVAKINPEAPEIIYVTYLGGWEGDVAYGVKVDDSGHAHVAGSTRSPDFPVLNGYDEGFGYPCVGGDWCDCGAGDWYTYCRDGFVTKLSADGTGIEYSTFMGDYRDNYFVDIALDDSGNAYAAGNIWFVLKLTSSGSLGYSYYWITSDTLAHAKAIDVDINNNAYVAGQYSSGSGSSAFIVKLNAAGSAQDYLYTFGGSNEDAALGIAVNDLGQAFVTGMTKSVDFPTNYPVQPSFGGGPYDAFVTQVNAAGDGIIASTYLGGYTTDIGRDIVYLGPEPPVCDTPPCLLPIGTFNTLYIIGDTTSTNFPTQNPVQASIGEFGYSDVFVAQYHDWGGYAFPGGPLVYNHLLTSFASYLGGDNGDYGYGIDADPATVNVYLTGQTSSSDFPLESPVELYHNGSGDAFITMLAQQPLPSWTEGDFYFDDGTAQGWTLDGAYNESGDGPSFTHALYEWTDKTNYPNAPGADSVGNNLGSIRMYPRPIYTNPFPVTGNYWIMQFHSPDLSDSPSWQQAVGYSVKIGEFMANNDPLYANLYVRVYDNDLATDRYFYSGTAQALTHNAWNTLNFDWSGASSFPTNYVVREVFVNIWGPKTDSDYQLDGVDLDEVILSPPEADLVITSMTTSPSSPTEGEVVNVSVTVLNQGLADAGGFYIDWYHDLASPPAVYQIGDKYQHVTSLAVGATYTMNTTYTYAAAGTYNMYAQVDTDQTVAESNEGNNVMGPIALQVESACVLDGDLNGDGIVNLSDFNILKAHWLESGAGIPGDINGDGIVNLSDFNILKANWLTSCP